MVDSDMKPEVNCILLGALLHDIGRLLRNPENAKISHSQLGMGFVSDSRITIPHKKTILECIRCHHQETLENADLPQDHPAHIIAEANILAAGAEREMEEQSESIIAGEMLKGNFVTKDELVNRLKEINYDLSNPDLVLELLETFGCDVHAVYGGSKRSYVSLFDHSKIVAALASCMYISSMNKNKKDDIFLAVYGSISGVHDFMFAVSDNGELKSVCARSFYIRLIIEHVIDEILETIGLSRANLLYSGGSCFCMLLPNTNETEALLEAVKKNINEWLLEKFSISLYLELSWTGCSADDLGDNGGITAGLGGVVRSLTEKKYTGSMQKFDYKRLGMIFDTEDVENEMSGDEAKCCVCGISKKDLFKWERLHSMQYACICTECYRLYGTGEKLLEIGSELRNGRYMVTVSAGDGNSGSNLLLPGIHGNEYLMEIAERRKAKPSDEESSNNYKRIYAINGSPARGQPSVSIRMAGYSRYAGCRRGGNTELKEPCIFGGHKANMALMKAEIDNLVAGLSDGFGFVRSAWKLSVFFKNCVDDICSGRTGQNGEMNLSVIYSDIDGVFVAGVWDELVEFSVNLRRAFSRLTGSKLTLTAGIAVFNDMPAIYGMFETVTRLYNKARGNGGDSLCFAGAGFGRLNETIRIYTWDEFESIVCEDKLRMLLKWFCSSGPKGNGDKHGKSIK